MTDPAASAAATPAVGASPSRRAWLRFRRNRLGYWSLVVFCVLVAVSLCAELVANDRPLVARYDARLLGFDLAGDRDLVGRVTERVKELEARGYTFEAADASFELLLREEIEGVRPTYWVVESWRAIVESRGDEDPSLAEQASAEATVKVRVAFENYSCLDHSLAI